MNCTDFRIKLTPLLDGRADEHDRPLLLRHAQECVACRELYESRNLARALIARSDGVRILPSPL